MTGTSYCAAPPASTLAMGSSSTGIALPSMRTGDQPGATTVSAHTLFDIARKLPEGSQVQLAAAEGKMTIVAGRARFQLGTLPRDDFPVIAEGELPVSFELPADTLKQIIDKTRFAISTEETRYYLNGIFLHVSADPQPVLIPGYTDLRSFSNAWPTLIKDEAGGSWHSYVQLGNWRMILPFPRGGQQETAERLLEEIRANWPPIIHLVTFPIITINHAVLLYGASETKESIRFSVYDPNHPEAAGELTYDRASRTFIFPATNYFEDGPVNVYEVYHGIYF